MDTHICPTCSQECAFKNGIMCTIRGCVKDNTSNNDSKETKDGNEVVDSLRSIFGMK